MQLQYELNGFREEEKMFKTIRSIRAMEQKSSHFPHYPEMALGFVPKLSKL